MRKVFLQGSYTEDDFDAVLASRQFVRADCYTIELINGVTLRSTTSQQDMFVVPPFDTMTRQFSGKKLMASGVKFKSAIGLDKDEQTLTLASTEDFLVPYSGDTLEGIPLMESLRRGDFDLGLITLDRYFSVGSGQPWVGAIRLFSGQVGPLDTVGRLTATIKVYSDLYLLDQQMPKNMYQSTCNNVFCKSRCSLTKSSFGTVGTASSGSTPSMIVWTGASGSYKLGTISVANDAGVEYTRTIRDVQGDNMYLSYPLDFVPAAGTSFTAYLGDDRTLASCEGYSNKTHFYGFPFMPVAETAY